MAIVLSSYSEPDSVMQIAPLQHPEDTTLPLSAGHPAAGPVSGHLKARLLQLAPGWLPLQAIRPLQLVQNAAARLIFNLPKFIHVTPLLHSLHWLPVADCLRFKTLRSTKPRLDQRLPTVWQ
ncbi:hypothetical protein NFI96_011956 [Prochilodus magdalenae]|nr:hypothetical protein NFI96_011956 [Prochilodus magdalenae]